MPKTSVTLEQDIYDAWKASGVNLADLVRRGLDAGPAEEVPGGDRIRAQGEERERLLSQFGHRIESLLGRNERLCGAVEEALADDAAETERAGMVQTLADGVKGLLTLLMEGYTLQPPRQPGERVLVLSPHDHTLDGPEKCPRCQLLRDNEVWMAPGGGVSGLARRGQVGSAGGGNSGTSPGGGGGNGSGDVGGYSVEAGGPGGGGGASVMGRSAPPGFGAMPAGGRYGQGAREPAAHGAYLGDAELQDPSDDIPGDYDLDAQRAIAEDWQGAKDPNRVYPDVPEGGSFPRGMEPPGASDPDAQ